MSIDIKTSSKKKKEGTLILDGVNYPKIKCEQEGNGQWRIQFNGFSELQIILAQPLPELMTRVSAITDYYASDFDKIASAFGAENVSIFIHPGTKEFFSASIACKMSAWEKKWSHRYLQDLVESKINKKEFKFSVRTESEDYIDFDIELKGARKDFRAPSLIAYQKIKETLEEVKQALETESGQYTLSIPFEFPPAAKAACEQYLVYFSQFLRDLGIDATAEVQGNLKNTILSITPTDRAHALSLIKEALAAYLELPNAPEGALESTDIAAHQLQANIMFLKSQLMLAQATIEQKNATIRLLTHTSHQVIEQKTPSSPTKPKKKAASEPIFGGLIEVSSVKRAGVKFNFAELVRRLRRDR